MYDEEVIAQIRPGMHLCSSDYKKWGEVDHVEQPPDGGSAEPYVAGHVDEDGRLVYVPAREVLEIRGGKCVRFDAALADADAQGWEQTPEFLVGEANG